MKKTIGYILLVLSVLAWCGIALLPFLNISKAQIALFTTGLVIAGEVLFYSSIVFLGKEIVEKFKAFFKRTNTNSHQTDIK